MGTRVHYAEEVKWEVIKMKQAGMTNKEIMEQLGIKIRLKLKHGCDGTKQAKPIDFRNKLENNIPTVKNRRK
ncbi:hypothetical protein S100141_04370 [Bacillus licheniformis]|nr:hypothetical protein S100141_04370 [Bacillus licheniformis]